MNKPDWRDIMRRESIRVELDRGKYIDESYPRTKQPVQINYKIVSLIAACVVLVIAVNVFLPTVFNGNHGVFSGGDTTQIQTDYPPFDGTLEADAPDTATHQPYTDVQWPSDTSTNLPFTESSKYTIMLKSGEEVPLPYSLVWAEIIGETDENGLQQILHADGSGFQYFFSVNKPYEIPIFPIDDIVAVPDISYNIIDITTVESGYPRAIVENITFGELKKYVKACDDNIIYIYFSYYYESKNEKGCNDYVFAVSKDGTSAY